MYKYEILLHGFGLAKQDLNFWNSNGDFRICSYVGYSNSIDEVLAGELEFSVLFTSTKKKKTPGLRGYGKQRFHWWKWGDYNSVQCSVCQISSRDRKNSIGRLAVMLLKMPDVDHKVSVYSWLQGKWHDPLLDFWRVKSPHPCTEGLHERLKHGAQVYWSGLNRDRHAYN